MEVTGFWGDRLEIGLGDDVMLPSDDVTLPSDNVTLPGNVDLLPGDDVTTVGDEVDDFCGVFLGDAASSSMMMTALSLALSRDNSSCKRAGKRP